MRRGRWRCRWQGETSGGRWLYYGEGRRGVAESWSSWAHCAGRSVGSWWDWGVWKRGWQLWAFRRVCILIISTSVPGSDFLGFTNVDSTGPKYSSIKIATPCGYYVYFCYASKTKNSKPCTLSPDYISLVCRHFYCFKPKTLTMSIKSGKHIFFFFNNFLGDIFINFFKSLDLNIKFNGLLIHLLNLWQKK